MAGINEQSLARLSKSGIYIYHPLTYYIRMLSNANISGGFSVAQAAQLLGVSEHQVRALIKDGELDSTRISERVQIIEANSVLRYQQLFAGKGRPLAPAIAFAALGEVSGQPIETLSYQQKRRLHQKLKIISPAKLVWQTRKRKNTKRFRCSQSFVEEVANDLVLSGVSAVDNSFDLTADSYTTEGYCREIATPALIVKYFLEEDPQGNVVLHCCQEMPWPNIEQMPVGVVAADLAESLNSRERAAGLAKLEELLNGYASLLNN